ncbi:uncharacterized protein LOC108598875 [Drosophila busckii]|uniref:uncharacterized protein LOC108598875 n=1 Tax=Drosophila busckii TaxID=30019 RepID=UPI00083E9716|nr:uncharacterized protein LOC108598875 [Drosophila busckii]
MATVNIYQRTVSQTTVGYSPLPEPNQEPRILSAMPQRQQLLYQQPTSCCMRDLRNRPQANALGAAALIFLSGGMNIAWSTGFDSLGDEMLICWHLRSCWFIAAIVGTLLSLLIARQLSYKLLMQLSCMLVIIGGIILSSQQLNVQALFAARYLNGIANGLVLPTTLAMAGELAVCYKRGSIASATEQMCCSLGIFMQIVLSVSWSNENDLSIDQIQGVLCALYGGIALALATIFSVESPVQLLQQGDEEQAIDALIRLQYPRAVTLETNEQLTEHSSYVEHNAHLSLADAWCQALPALLRITLLRVLYAMSASMLVSVTLTLTSISVYGLNTGPYVLFGLLRLAGSASGAIVLDTLGRKLPQLLGFMIAGGTCVGLASRFPNEDLPKQFDLKVALWLLLMFQFFAGVGFAPSSTYLAEAFPLPVKRICIAMVYIMELGVQLAICSVDFSVHVNTVFFYGLGIFMLLGFLFSHWYLPETKFMTLRQAQLRFRDFS